MTDTQGAQSPEQRRDTAETTRVFVEPRWPIALAMGSFIVDHGHVAIGAPHRESLGPGWLVPEIEIALLLA